MGILTRAIAGARRLFNQAGDRKLTLTDPLGWLNLFGLRSRSGTVVTMETALQLSTVWACIRLTAQAVASLPLDLYERRSANDRVPLDDDLAEVICHSPNADQTTIEFWEGMAAWLAARGNAYALKHTIGRRLVALETIPGTACTPYRTPDNELRYRINDRGKAEDLPREKIFHIRGFGFGGDLGLSPIGYGVQSIGAAIAAEEVAGKTFENGLMTSGVLSSDQILNSDQRGQLQKLMQQYVGSKNAGKMMILEAGLKYQALSLNPEDAQLLETRRFQVEEVCRWFGVPPIIIGHAAQGQTMWGSGVEHILISWLTLGIGPMCTRIEARINKDLIRPFGSRKAYAKYNREALLQMDSAAKANFLSSMVQNGLMTRNEGRAKLELPRRDGADTLTAQTNLAPLDLLGAKQRGEA